MNKTLPKIDERWSLFLDRDGVINKLLPDDYVKSWIEFEFIEGVLEALPYLTSFFGHCFVVTNQQGIGKEIMTHEDISAVHEKMMDEVWNAGAKIDQIYYCPDLAIYNPVHRKPNPGMAIQAQTDFEKVDFLRSLMVGDSESDIIFGNQLGMFTVKVGPKSEYSEANYICNDLYSFYQLLKKEIQAETT